MKEGWLKFLSSEKCKEYIENKYSGAQNVQALEFNGFDGIVVLYDLDGDKHHTVIDELGEGTTINPFDNADFFALMRKLTEGHIIDGNTYEQDFIKKYLARVEQKRNQDVEFVVDTYSQNDRTLMLNQVLLEASADSDKIVEFVKSNNIETHPNNDESFVL